MNNDKITKKHNLLNIKDNLDAIEMTQMAEILWDGNEIDH